MIITGLIVLILTGFVLFLLSLRLYDDARSSAEINISYIVFGFALFVLIVGPGLMMVLMTF